MANATIKTNEQYNSTEIFFDQKPEQEIIAALKALRFRWNPKKSCWYGFAKIESLEDLNSAKIEKAPATAKAKKEKKNKFGVKVGDFFSASWGYDQTNVDYFQVIELVGETSVRVREVLPECIGSEAISGMSENRTYKLDRSKILPPKGYSVFINDQEKGDLKRLKSYAADGISNPQFNISSFASATYCTDETETVYESWYA